MAEKTYKVYDLKVTLQSGLMWDFSKEKISRTIRIRGNQKLRTLHNAIFDAFERYDAHLYEFYLSPDPENRKKKKFDRYSARNYQRFTEMEYTDEPFPGQKDVKINIDKLGLNQGDIFFYLFDFGDDWVHQIKVISIDETAKKEKLPKVVESKGEAPPQYPDMEDEDDWDDEEE